MAPRLASGSAELGACSEAGRQKELLQVGRSEGGGDSTNLGDHTQQLLQPLRQSHDDLLQQNHTIA